MEYKVQQLQKRALHFIVNDFDKSYPELFCWGKEEHINENSNYGV